MYNLREPRQRARYLRATTKRRDRNFAAAERIIRRVFSAERGRVIASLRSPKGYASAIHTDEWVKAFKQIWLLSGENSWKYNEETWGVVQRRVLGKPTATKPKALMAMYLYYKQIPAWNTYVNDYIDDKGGDKIKGIAETTQDKVKSELKEGIANEESIPQLADRISGVYDGFEGGRATVIARSETVEAFNRGSQAQAQEANSTLDNMWIATMDDRTREEHADMDGVTVPYDQEFDCADGTTWPGDAVNCRCTIGYAIPEVEPEPVAEPEVFTDYNEAEKAFADYADTLTKGEQNAVADYTQDSFRWINDYLRGGLMESDAQAMYGRSLEEIAADAKQLEGILQKAPKYEGTVYRVINTDNYALRAPQSVNIGFDGFTSTSSSRNSAVRVADVMQRNEPKATRIIYEIQNARGTVIEPLTLLDEMNMKEVLLDANSQGKVIRMVKGPDVVRIVVDMAAK
jgi:SPP1 gp7 family putative phage head morphogenesis protein